MNTNVKKTLYWSPRILCILLALFLSIFAMDVFDEGYGFWDSMIALMIHLIPVYMVVFVLILAWRWEWIGAVMYLGLAVFYVFLTSGNAHWGAYFSISGSLGLVGILFLINWLNREQMKTG
ncbi:MAG: hypothetical protein H8D46_03010 [FCB group bacterium]|nr:hypothetical protein [FCB group bacterium]